VAEEPGEHVLFQNVWKENSTSIDVYKASAVREARRVAEDGPEAIVEEVKKSNLRGRGGAGFRPG